MSRKLVIHDSTQGGPARVTSCGRISRDKRSVYHRSFALPHEVLRFGSAAEAGDYVSQQILAREEFDSQHGPVKILWKDGKPVR